MKTIALIIALILSVGAKAQDMNFFWSHNSVRPPTTKYILIDRIQISGTGYLIKNTLSDAKQACYDYNDTNGRVINRIATSGYAAAMEVGNTVYSEESSESTLVVSDGYYLLLTVEDGTLNNSKIERLAHIVSGVIVSIQQGIEVGDSFGGGLIAYIYAPGDAGYTTTSVDGLVMSSSDLSTGAVWGCSGTSITTSSELGYGQLNTNNILSACSTSGIAARLCDSYVSGIYTNWFLPSNIELQKCFIGLPGNVASDTYYWSSSQTTSTGATAVKIIYPTINITGSAKTNSYRVRAVKYF